MLKNRRYSDFFSCTSNVTFHTANTIAATPNNTHIYIPLFYLSSTTLHFWNKLSISSKNYFFNNTKNKAATNKTTTMINPENIITLLFSTTFWCSIAEIETAITISAEISTNHDILIHRFSTSFRQLSLTFILSQNRSQTPVFTKFLLKQNSIHEISNCNLSYQHRLFS